MKYLLFLFALVFLCTGCNNVSTIASNVSERDANEIVVLLASRGIQAEKVPAPAATVGAGSAEKLWNIAVPARFITDAITILNQAGLPRLKGTSLLDLFGQQGLVPSDIQNRIRYQEGLSEQLATTIRKMDGIIDANVQISFPQDEEMNIPMTASVYVKHRGVLDNPNSLLITKIKRLISSAVPGLTIDNVSVVSDRALIADITVGELQQEESLEYVSVWGVIVAKQSTALFRTILYLFLILLFILACTIVWLVWKFYPFVESQGFKTLLDSKPYTPAVVPPPAEEASETPKDELV